MKREITWTTGTGKEAKITVALNLEKTIWADGDNVTVNCCEMDIIAEVDGLGCIGTGRPLKITPQQGCIAKIGKLGISAENLGRINAAIAEIEATPEWIEKLRREEAAQKGEEEYDKHRRMMKKVMGY